MSNRARALVSGLFSTAIAVGALVSGVSTADAATFAAPPSTPRVELTDEAGNVTAPDEDSVYFDCRVHGNRVCGAGASVPVILAPGLVLIVPVEYAPPVQ